MCLKEAPQNRCCGQSMLCLNSLCAPTQRQCGPEWLQAILQGRPAPDCQIIPNSTSGVLGQSSGVYCSYAIMDNNERANQHGGLNATMCVCVCVQFSVHVTIILSQACLPGCSLRIHVVLCLTVLALLMQKRQTIYHCKHSCSQQDTYAVYLTNADLKLLPACHQLSHF